MNKNLIMGPRVEEQFGKRGLERKKVRKMGPKKCRTPAPSQGKCHFLPGGGLLIIGGDQALCLRSKGGIKRFFQIKKGGSLIFFKEIKYFVKHS